MCFVIAKLALGRNGGNLAHAVSKAEMMPRETLFCLAITCGSMPRRSLRILRDPGDLAPDLAAPEAPRAVKTLCLHTVMDM